MKRSLFSGLAIAVCLSIVSSAMAQVDQYGLPKTGYQYSSYGIQDLAPGPQDDASPSDRAVPAPIPEGEAPATPCSEGNVYNSVVGDNCGTARCRTRNWVVGVRGLLFERDYEDDYNLGSNAAGRNYFSTDADAGTMGGVEFFFGARNCSGWGWNFGYWGLYPNQGDTTINGPGLWIPHTGFNNLWFPVTGHDLYTVYNSADYWRVYRDNEIHNFEFNVLRNGGCVSGLCCNNVNLEWSFGVRYFKFDEEFRWATFNISDPALPFQINWDSETENELLGFQLGVRTEHALRRCLSLSVGAKFGVYNNDMRHYQSFNDGSGNYAQINAGTYTGTDYNFSSTKSDISTLGELDLGLIYQFHKCWRATAGYRLLGVTGVALAPDQAPYNWTDAMEIQRINSNGSLLLHGGYFGLERCF